MSASSSSPTGISPAGLARAERWTVGVGVLAVSLASWLWLIDARVHPHPHAREGIVSTASMWWAMTLAMMLPTSLSWFLILGRFGRNRGTVFGFAGGYLSLWFVYGLAAASLQLALRRGALLGDDAALPSLPGGALLVGAGLFQLTPLKNACLDRCRNPLSYFLTHWNDGRWGPVAMGARHGVDCLGCCWALMATAFALGVMNVLWMAVLTLAAAVEKLTPRGALLGRAMGVFLIGFGALRALALA